MQYPLVLNSFHNNLTLWIPNPELIKPTYDALCLESSSTLFPFWAKLWPSSLALTLFLQKNIELVKNKKIVEVGAGIGLPSFSIASEAAEITITDYSADAVDLMQKNIAHLGFKNIEAVFADWNFFPEAIHAEIVLLSDTNYAPSNFQSLIKLIERYIKKGATIILATPERITASPFIEQLHPFIIEKELIAITYNEALVTVGLFVLK